jgi:hypothetical protein
MSPTVPGCDRPKSEACRQLRRCPIVPEPYGQEMWDRRQNYPLRRCPQAGTDRAPFILAHPSRGLYGRLCWFLVRKSRSPQASSPLPPYTLPEGSYGPGMGPRNQARWLPTDGLPSTQLLCASPQMPKHISLYQCRVIRPQHCLYFLPEPQGHGSLRPTFVVVRW